MAHMLLHAARDSVVAARRTLAVAKVDVKGAYDNVRHDVLWDKLSVFGVPEQLVDLLRQSYANSQAHVKVAGGCTSDSYQIDR